MADLSAVPAGPDIARAIATTIDGAYAHGVMFTADSNGDIIHATALNLETGRKDAWVLTVEWDGERDQPANNAPQEAP
jgi:hypothetical protein